MVLRFLIIGADHFIGGGSIGTPGLSLEKFKTMSFEDVVADQLSPERLTTFRTSYLGAFNTFRREVEGAGLTLDIVPERFDRIASLAT